VLINSGQWLSQPVNPPMSPSTNLPRRPTD